MTAAITVRQATSADAPELLALIQRAMAVYARNSGIERPLDAELETLDDLRVHLAVDYVLVAEIGGRLAGTVRLVRQDEQTAYFSRFAVMPTLQRSGVGHLLYLAALRYLNERGYRQVLLHTALTNQPLVTFYQTRGFELISTGYDRGYPRGTFRKWLDLAGDQPSGKSP
jgi:ribosomal protein S18 acetylase RimI-like enzyme